MVKVGIIGGSGLEDPNILDEKEEVEVTTPYGKPSDKLVIGKIKGVDVVILSTHDRQHRIPPTQVNYRANIYALKEQGCTHIIATTACGSLKQEIGRGDLVILDQFIDFTRHRKVSFHEEFEAHKPIHCPMADPFDKELRRMLIKVCKDLGFKYHEKGTVITIEGPRFSTRAESNVFRQWADVINMSIAPEAALANELGIKYAAIAMSTDYDCWKTDEEPVTWAEILKVFNDNSEKVKKILVDVLKVIR